MTLSIITINYNNLEGLRRTINSVISQTWHDFEWIIIDGGSTDGSKELIEETANELAASDFNPLSYWCSEPDKGIYNAMNKGIKHCNGEYINCMNSGDEFYAPHTLAKIFNITYSAGVLYGDTLRIGKNTYIERFPDILDIYYLYHKCLCHQAMFVKKTLLIENGFNEKYRICADYAKWIELSLKNIEFKHIDHIVCKFDGTGISATSIELMKKENAILFSEQIPTHVTRLIKEHEEYVEYNPYYAFQVKDIIKHKGLTFRLLCYYIDFMSFLKKMKIYIKNITIRKCNSL